MTPCQQEVLQLRADLREMEIKVGELRNEHEECSDWQGETVKLNKALQNERDHGVNAANARIAELEAYNDNIQAERDAAQSHVRHLEVKLDVSERDLKEIQTRYDELDASCDRALTAERAETARLRTLLARFRGPADDLADAVKRCKEVDAELGIEPATAQVDDLNARVLTAEQRTMSGPR